MIERTVTDEKRGGVVESLIDWAKRSAVQEKQIQNGGGKVLYHESRTGNGVTTDYMVVSNDGLYTFRVNGITRRSARSLEDCVRQARAAGYVDEITQIEITRGKAAAAAARKIIAIRKMLGIPQDTKTRF